LKTKYFNNDRLRRLELAGHPVRMFDDWTVKRDFWGKQMEELKQGDQN